MTNLSYLYEQADCVCETDSEYRSQENTSTTALTTQVKEESRDSVIYVHPSSPLASSSECRHRVFNAPLAILDYKGMQWRPINKRLVSRKKISWVVAIAFFYSLKDIEYHFAHRKDYLEALRVFEQSRRTYISNNGHNTVRLPYEVYSEEDKQWKVLSIQILDYSALFGAVGLKAYARITGVEMKSKDLFTKKEKSDMHLMYIQKPQEFDEYAKGDNVLLEIYKGACNLFDYICQLLSIEPLDDYGMSTGTIVARIVSKAIAKRGGFIDKDVHLKTGELIHITAVQHLSKVCEGSHPHKIQKILSIGSNKDSSIPYVGMVDGGRAVNATRQRVLEGLLADVDIKSAYGSGLRNQLFPIGSPTKIWCRKRINDSDIKFTLRDFLKKYSSQLIPGLWQARISTREGIALSFEQDLFISKVQKKFTLWENSQEQEDDWLGESASATGSDNRIYDASMVLLTRQIHQAIIQHDLLQIAQNYFSNQEWSELLDNCYVESALIYEKKNRRSHLIEDKMTGLSISSKEGVEISGSKLFFTVPLEDIVQPLLEERVKQKALNKSGSPQEQVIKLVTNTIYGCIASQYFYDGKTGISNTVVGNNITARCRALAWCMEKGLGTQMSITDGGVLNLNKIPNYKKMSSQIFSDMYDGKSVSRYNRTINIEFKPLLDQEVDKELSSLIKTETNPEGSIEIDNLLLGHLNKLFPKLDLFTQKQFTLTTKSIHTKLIKHSKVDYALQTLDGSYKYALRGMTKTEQHNPDGTLSLNSVGEPVYEIADSGKHLFEAIEQGQPLEIRISTSRLLSLAEWRNDYTSKNPRHAGLMPHDQISKELKFYSITPLGCRFATMTEYKTMINEYEIAKSSEDAANAVAQVAYDYGYPA